MPVLRPSKKFEKGLKRLPDTAARHAAAALKKFMENPQHPSLNFEKVKHSKNKLTIRFGKGPRIVLNKIDADTYEIVDIGTHDYIYKTYG